MFLKQHLNMGSDLGERSVLGIDSGAFSAQYKVLRDRGHSRRKPIMKQKKQVCILLLIIMVWIGSIKTVQQPHKEGHIGLLNMKKQYVQLLKNVMIQ